MKGTSNAPLILGIMGAVIMLPGLMCVTVCGTFLDFGAAMNGIKGGHTFYGLVFGIIPVVAGVIGGVKGKTNPILSCISLLISAIFTYISWYSIKFASLFHIIALILFVVGSITAIAQNMED